MPFNFCFPVGFEIAQTSQNRRRKALFSFESSCNELMTVMRYECHFEDQIKAFVYIRSSLPAHSTFSCIAVCKNYGSLIPMVRICRKICKTYAKKVYKKN